MGFFTKKESSEPVSKDVSGTILKEVDGDFTYFKLKADELMKLYGLLKNSKSDKQKNELFASIIDMKRQVNVRFQRFQELCQLRGVDMKRYAADIAMTSKKLENLEKSVQSKTGFRIS